MRGSDPVRREDNRGGSTGGGKVTGCEEILGTGLLQSLHGALLSYTH